MEAGWRKKADDAERRVKEFGESDDLIIDVIPVSRRSAEEKQNTYSGIPGITYYLVSMVDTRCMTSPQRPQRDRTRRDNVKKV